MINAFKNYLLLLISGVINTLQALLNLLESGTRRSKSNLQAAWKDKPLSDALELGRRIQWIIRLRYGVVPIVPVLIVFLSWWERSLVDETQQLSTLERLGPNLGLMGINLALNVFYAYAIRRGRYLKRIAYSQIILDTIIFTLVIYSTGGVASPFTFVYFLPILTACLLVSFNAGILCAFIASLFYVGLLFLQSRGEIGIRSVFPPLAELSRNNRGYSMLMRVVSVYAFFLVALLSGLLSMVIKRKEKELQAANFSLDQRVSELSLLFDVGDILNRTTNLDKVLHRVMNLLVQRMRFDRVLLYLVTDDRKALKLKLLARHPKFSRKPPESYTVTMELHKRAGLTARAGVERKLYNITDPLNHPLINKALAKRIGLNPFAVAPMVVRGRLIGVIGVDHKYSGGPISDSEAKSLVIFANQAGLAIENARLHHLKRG